MKQLFLHVHRSEAWAKRRAAKCNGPNLARTLLKKLEKEGVK